MDDYLFQKVLRDNAAFQPPQPKQAQSHGSRNLRFIEIRKGDRAFRSRNLDDESEVNDWLNEVPKKDGTASIGEVLRVLLSPWEMQRGRIHDLTEEISGLSLLPLTLSRDTFLRTMEKLRIPKAYLPSLNRRIANFVWIPRHDDAEGFILQTNWTRTVNFSVAVSHHRGNGDTTVMVHGLCAEEIDYVTEYLEKSVACSDEMIWFPLLLPVILMEYKAISTYKHASTCYRAIYAMEKGTGFFAHAVHDKTPYEEPPKDMEIDFNGITREITSATKELARYLQTCKTNIRLFDDLDEFTNRHFKNATDGHDVYAMEITLAKTAYLKSFFQGTGDRCSYLSERAQAQRQTVYGLLAQNDNVQSIRVAEASHNVALVANFFLPPTFAATFFSTTFFNFQPQDGKHTVSPWVWLYVVTSVGLTLLVQVFWYLLTSAKAQKKKQSAKRFSRATEMGPNAAAAEAVQPGSSMQFPEKLEPLTACTQIDSSIP